MFYQRFCIHRGCQNLLKTQLFLIKVTTGACRPRTPCLHFKNCYYEASDSPCGKSGCVQNLFDLIINDKFGKLLSSKCSSGSHLYNLKYRRIMLIKLYYKNFCLENLYILKFPANPVGYCDRIRRFLLIFVTFN